MSVNIVSEDHINAIVGYAVRMDLEIEANAPTLVMLMAGANIREVNRKYHCKEIAECVYKPHYANEAQVLQLVESFIYNCGDDVAESVRVTLGVICKHIVDNYSSAGKNIYKSKAYLTASWSI
jgi:hypothetical protein